MIRFFLLVLISVMIGSTPSLALQSIVSPSFRMYPVAGDLTATVKQEKLLWDQRTQFDPTNYSLLQVQALADAGGAIELGVSYYPISYFKLMAAVGGAYRYYNNPSFNCALTNCQGFLVRNRIGFSFLGATGENHEWLVIPEYNMLLVSASQSNLPIADEVEVIYANGQGDVMDRYQVVAGKKLNNQFFGAMIRVAQYRSSGQRNELDAIIGKVNWRDSNFVLGVGRYASDLYLPGPTFFVSYEWRWGYSQALF